MAWPFSSKTRVKKMSGTSIERQTYVINPEELAGSQNPAIAMMHSHQFYLIPSEQSSLEEDANRDTFDFRLQDQVIAKRTANASDEGLKHQFLTSCLKQGRTANEALGDYVSIDAAYTQDCFSTVHDAFQAGLMAANIAAQNKFEAKKKNKTPAKPILYNVQIPKMCKGTIAVDQQVLTAMTNTLEINLTEGAEQSTLAAVDGSTRVFMQLMPVSEQMYASWLEMKRQKYLQNGLLENSYDMQVINARIQATDKYPKYLYQLVKIETNSQFVRDTLMSEKLPDLVDIKYQAEVILKPKTALAKITILDALCQKYRDRYQEKIEKIMQRELPAEYDTYLKRTSIENDALKIKLGFDIDAAVDYPSEAMTQLKSSNRELRKYIDKYAAMRSVHATLQTNARVDIKLQNCAKEYSDKSGIIDTCCDSVGMFIVKCITTVLTGGLACLFGLWKPKSAEFNNEVDAVLSPSFICK
jgi:hypothetical protein